MGVDFKSKIAFCIEVTKKVYEEEKEVKKFNEDTGEPYIKKEIRKEEFYFIGSCLEPLNELEFYKIINDYDISYNNEQLNSIVITFNSLSEKGFDWSTFTISELQEFHSLILENMRNCGILLKDEDIEIMLIHYLY